MGPFKTFTASLHSYAGRDLPLHISSHRAFLLVKNKERIAEVRQAILNTLQDKNLCDHFRQFDEELRATGVLIFSCTEEAGRILQQVRLPHVAFIEACAGELYTRKRRPAQAAPLRSVP